MARTVNSEAVAAKRREILNAAGQLVLRKGFEQMSIRDILDEVQMSSGAFHHYFDSRGALLEAFVEHIQQETEKPLLPILHNPKLTAIEKLQGFLDTLDRLRMAHKADVVSLGHVWYADDNAIVRQKVDQAVFEQRAPLLTEIVQQGIREGSFSSASPDKAGEVIMSLLQGMDHIQARLFLASGQEYNDPAWIAEVVATHTAYMDAIERVIGAPAHSFARLDANRVKNWVTRFTQA